MGPTWTRTDSRTLMSYYNDSISCSMCGEQKVQNTRWHEKSSIFWPSSYFMFFLALLTLLVLSVADGVGEIGTIRIRQRGHRKARNLIISSGKAFASEWKTIFKYEPEKRAISVSETRFLSVDERGPLGILPEFSSGWLVGKLYRGHRQVSYLRDGDFYVCGDDRIDFIGNCDGALRISLYFEPYSVMNL